MNIVVRAVARWLRQGGLICLALAASLWLGVASVTLAATAPVFPPVPIQPFSIGNPVALPLHAIGDDGLPALLQLQNAPVGAAIDGGVFRWTPDESVGDELTVIVHAIDQLDPRNRTTRRIRFQQEQLPASAEVESLPLPSAAVAHNASASLLPILGEQELVAGRRYSLHMKPSAVADGLPMLTVEQLPFGAKFIDRHTGLYEFEWTPEAGQLGRHELGLRLLDPQGRHTLLTRTVPLRVIPGGHSQPEPPTTQSAGQAIVADKASSAVPAIEIPAVAKANPPVSSTPQEQPQSPVAIAAPAIDKIPVQVVSPGHTVKFVVSTYLPTEGDVLLHVDRLPGTASLDHRDDGTREFYWETSAKDEGQHLFRFTAVNPASAEHATTMDALVIIGNPDASSTMPAADNNN